MLFSNEQVAAFISANFEPVWQTVRPVPLVHIDFGNGIQVTRTLHGNIATSVCTADGLVLDILPGIYEPRTYLDRLQQFRLLENYARQARQQGNLDAVLQAYHQKQAEALGKKQNPDRFVNVAPISKARIERGIKAMLMPAAQKNGPTAGIGPGATGAAQALSFSSPQELAAWKALAQDTEVNETTRRTQIHELLAKAGLVRPDKILKPLYKDVLHADLDDPYLGLGSVLFAGYPFAGEEAAVP
ncbi:MAG: hypothetical protein E6K70_05355 [Planctomycetota bacterium]|nr:MAG: hypothetical protein E6K70_05355 [Planctomycetota bacterium]